MGAVALGISGICVVQGNVKIFLGIRPISMSLTLSCAGE